MRYDAWRPINNQKPFDRDEVYELDKAPFYAYSIFITPCNIQTAEGKMGFVVGTVMTLLKELTNG